MTCRRVLGVLAPMGLLLGALCLGIAGCGGHASPQAGGRCLSQGACWEVIDPPSYSIQAECGATGGNWESGACVAIQYERRCTQDTMVSTNGGPEITVRYVYYRLHSSTFVCLGPEEIL